MHIDELQAQKLSAEDTKELMDSWKWVGAGIGAAGFAVTGIFALIGNAEYEVYQAATVSADSEASHTKLSVYSGLQIGGLVLGALGAGAGTVMFFPPDPQVYETQIAALSDEKARLSGSIQ